MAVKNLKYKLGIDVGVASLGLAIVEVDNAGNEKRVIQGYVRTWSVPEGGEARRLARSQRRIIDRKQSRLKRLSKIFLDYGFGHPIKKLPKELLDKSPIKLRAKAIGEKISIDELQRVILHMAKHRGSNAFDPEQLANDESDNGDSESRITLAGIKALEKEMKEKNFQTYGQYLRWREKRGFPTRINQEKTGNQKYAYYPSRALLKEEFNLIWGTQKGYHDGLTDSFKEKLEQELFLQREIKLPPPGNCPYIQTEERLPRTSRLFHIRRIYEEVNNLRFFDRDLNELPYSREQRDNLVTWLMDGNDLTKTKIKSICDLKHTTKINFERVKTRDKIAKYPFSKKDISGQWMEIGDSLQDQILAILCSYHKNRKARIRSEISRVATLDEKTIARLLTIKENNSLQGYGRMGLTATKFIIEELKSDHTLSSREAEDRAGLKHAMTYDGVIYERLPYYGEILTGHTLKPVWVSRKKPTDQPPNTNQYEEKHGRIPNPVVHVALNQIRHTVNAIIDEYGVPWEIYIELARDLAMNQEARSVYESTIRKNTRLNDDIRKKLIEIDVNPTRHNIQKYKLWEGQGYTCIYTGHCISLTQLYEGEVEIDHLLPYSKTIDDSMMNKVVCFKDANAYKNNRTPYEAFGDNENPKYDWSGIIGRIESFPQGKQDRFLENALTRFQDNPDYWPNRFANDNSYIARVTGQYLTSLYGKPGSVVSVSSRMIGLLRHGWGLNKVLNNKEENIKRRDDHRHHFIDALVVAFAKRSIIKEIQTSARRCEQANSAKFVDKISTPMGMESENFVTCIRDIAKKVQITRKQDHSRHGQLHEDTLRGIAFNSSARDDDKSYVSRTKVKLANFNTLDELKKKRFRDTLPNRHEIEIAKANLAKIKTQMEELCIEAENVLLEEKQRHENQGLKGPKITSGTIYNKAVKLSGEKEMSQSFLYYENLKLTNIRREGNRFIGGYIGGRNHRMDIYKDKQGRVKWQVISMMEANDNSFIPEAEKKGSTFIWSAHKDDTLLINNPDNQTERIRVTVMKIKDGKMGVVMSSDARDGRGRQLWEKGLRFYESHQAQRIITDYLGNITYRYPKL